MNVLWLTEFFPRDKKSIIGGVQSRCFYVHRYLSKKHKINVLRSVHQSFAKAGIISMLARIPYFFIQIYEGLVSDFDLIEASNFVTYLPAIIISKLKKKPLIFWYPDVFINHWAENVGLIGVVGEIVERIILTIGADHYIAISETVKNKLIKFGISKNKMSVIYCGVDKQEIESVRKLKLKNKYDLCAVSRLVSYKRISDLLVATSEVKRKIKSIKLVILGNGPEKNNLIELVKKLDLTSNVKFIDRLEKHEGVLKLISSSKILCHPSIVEGFGITIVEAMNSGRPVVVADTPIAREVTQRRGVLLYKSRDCVSLSKQIVKLLTSSKLYLQKSKEAVEVAKKYDWKLISSQTGEIYEKISK